MLATIFVVSLVVSAGQEAPCASAGTGTASAEICLAQAETKAADAAKAGSGERREHLAAAVAHYRRAASPSAPAEARKTALAALLGLYDAQHLNDLPQAELVVRELLVLVPNDLSPLYRLARQQEDAGLVDAAETTLVDARRQQPETSEPYKMLAQFYARRAVALVAKEKKPEPLREPGAPDEHGIYQVGGGVEPPNRWDRPIYPKDAAAVGIQGVVQVEIVVDDTGVVTDARVVQSVPMLDDAALRAVRRWRFDPAIVNGRPVPVRMIVSVNFTTTR